MAEALQWPMSSVATPRARVSFDGTTVTVCRRHLPGLRWRPPVAYSMARVLGAELVWLGGEGERRRFDLYLARSPTLRIPITVGRNPHRGVGLSRKQRWDALTAAINAAAGHRVRRVLDATLGLGPWSEDTWRQAEALAPELSVFGERGTPMSGRAPQSHRDVIERALLAPLRSPGTVVDSIPVPVGTWSGFLADRSAHDREQAEAWHHLIAGLANQPGALPMIGDA
ncbi:hypothetical protein [Streptomyces sp. NPDC059828]|uniref:hypothetical protein n=1 Tax=Streptomyces sp. NPDC059828 TaxID=3346965 RepID=UPI0036642251